MNTKEILIAARAKIEKPENWCKGHISRDNEGHPCSFEKGASWCAIGAVAATLDGQSPRLSQALEPLYSLIDWESLGDFNDTHTHAEVLDLFDRAIASCE